MALHLVDAVVVHLVAVVHGSPPMAASRVALVERKVVHVRRQRTGGVGTSANSYKLCSAMLRLAWLSQRKRSGDDKGGCDSEHLGGSVGPLCCFAFVFFFLLSSSFGFGGKWRRHF